MDMTQEIIDIIENDEIDSEGLAKLHRAVLKARNLPYAGMQIEASEYVIEQINGGLFDKNDGLNRLSEAVRRRRAIKGGQKRAELDDLDLPEQEFIVGQTVKVIGRLKPNYLLGHEFDVVKVNPKTCRVRVPNMGIYRRFKGQDINIPKDALQIIR
jgi:hypothetical protein